MRRDKLSILLAACIGLPALGCGTATPRRDLVPPEPQVKSTEQVRPPVQITARDTPSIPTG